MAEVMIAAIPTAIDPPAVHPLCQPETISQEREVMVVDVKHEVHPRQATSSNPGEGAPRRLGFRALGMVSKPPGHTALQQSQDVRCSPRPSA